MATVAIDFDDTLVGYKKYGTPGEWLPGACEALRFFRNHDYSIIIHSCRASWPEGRAEIVAKLKTIGFTEGAGSRMSIEPKPYADMYIDDKGVHFTGEWSGDMKPTLNAIVKR